MATDRTIDALFPNRIPRVDWLRDGGKVPVPNSSEATYSEDRDGVVWIRKSGGVEEIIAAERAAFLEQRELESFVREACEIAREPRANLLAVALVRRRPAASALVSRHVAVLGTTS